MSTIITQSGITTSVYTLEANHGPDDVVLGEYAGVQFAALYQAQDARDHALEILASDEDSQRWDDLVISIERRMVPM